MSILTNVTASAEAVVQLPMPAIMFGVLAAVIFAVLGATVFAYRDVANRHSQKPAAQPGAGLAGTNGSGH